MSLIIIFPVGIIEVIGISYLIVMIIIVIIDFIKIFARVVGGCLIFEGFWLVLILYFVALYLVCCSFLYCIYCIFFARIGECFGLGRSLFVLVGSCFLFGNNLCSLF